MITQVSETNRNSEAFIMTFAGKPPYLWTKPEVREWITWCAEEYSLSISQSQLASFSLNGKALLMLRQEDFLKRAPTVGDVIFNVLQRFSEHYDVVCVNDIRAVAMDATVRSRDTIDLRQLPALIALPEYTGGGYQMVRSMHNIPPDPDRSLSSSPRTLYPINYDNSSLPLKKRIRGSNVPEDVAHLGIPSPISHQSSEYGLSDISETKPMEYLCKSIAKCEDSSLSAGSDTGSDHSEERESHDQTSPMSEGSEQTTEQNNDVTSSDNKLLWEFIYELLEQNCKTHPVRYLDATTLTFKITNPALLAQMWGNRKQKTNMSYEKLSRALRYYYKDKIINKVPGKKLTYRYTTHPTKIVKGIRGAKPGVPHKRRKLSDGDKQTDTEILDLSMKTMKKKTRRHIRSVKLKCNVQQDRDDFAKPRLKSDGINDSFAPIHQTDQDECVDLRLVKANRGSPTLNEINLDHGKCSRRTDDGSWFQSVNSALSVVNRTGNFRAENMATDENPEDYVAFVLKNEPSL